MRWGCACNNALAMANGDTLRVQQFGISFKLMLITCVGVSLQGQNTLTRHQWCHIDESDNVELPIVWQFVNYMDSWATFMVFSKMENINLDGNERNERKNNHQQRTMTH
ncbi:hypothetical protein JHK87_015930 [Glycine soja]|nr:hypothetical protein JHK87_015930 [Glycine soja]